MVLIYIESSKSNGFQFMQLDNVEIAKKVVIAINKLPNLKAALI